jgi:hypothetical protein
MRHTITLLAIAAGLSGAAVAAYDEPIRQLEATVSKYQDRIPPQGTRTAEVTRVGVNTSVISRTPVITVAQR